MDGSVTAASVNYWDQRSADNGPNVCLRCRDELNATCQLGSREFARASPAPVSHGVEQPITVPVLLGFLLLCYSAEGKMCVKQML